jgi:hypothetical protein
MHAHSEHQTLSPSVLLGYGSGCKWLSQWNSFETCKVSLHQCASDCVSKRHALVHDLYQPLYSWTFNGRLLPLQRFSEKIRLNFYPRAS